MAVVTPEQARQILDEMAAKRTETCALCGASFRDDIPAGKSVFGPFPVWLCPQCKERHENFRARQRSQTRAM